MKRNGTQPYQKFWMLGGAIALPNLLFYNKIKNGAVKSLHNLFLTLNFRITRRFGMAQILVENLDPVILEKLENLAKQHGRSLQEELKHILQQAAETLTNYQIGGDMQQVRDAVARAQIRYANKFFSDSAELIREDRER